MCLYPIPAYQSGPGVPPILWPPIGTDNLKLSCGTCIECRIRHATVWGIRCAHHAMNYDHVSFNTLTFNDEHYPDVSNQWIQPFQGFMKRLRILRVRHPDLLLTDPSQP